MKPFNLAARRPWHSLSVAEKQRRLAELRKRHQSQIEVEVRRLRSR